MPTADILAQCLTTLAQAAHCHHNSCNWYTPQAAEQPGAGLARKAASGCDGNQGKMMCTQSQGAGNAPPPARAELHFQHCCRKGITRTRQQPSHVHGQVGETKARQDGRAATNGSFHAHCSTEIKAGKGLQVCARQLQQAGWHIHTPQAAHALKLQRCQRGGGGGVQGCHCVMEACQQQRLQRRQP